MKEIVHWCGNHTTVNPKKDVVPNDLLNPNLESMDSIDGNGPPIRSDENVARAKTWVDRNHK